jgi:hypothetical protein
MVSTTSSFPNFKDGDVKIILSEKPEDSLVLHTATLAKSSDYFKASLQKLEGSHNKYLKQDGNITTEVDMKLLKLDFEDEDMFPLLIGAVSRTQLSTVTPMLTPGRHWSPPPRR